MHTFINLTSKANNKFIKLEFVYHPMNFIKSLMLPPRNLSRCYHNIYGKRVRLVYNWIVAIFYVILIIMSYFLQYLNSTLMLSNIYILLHYIKNNQSITDSHLVMNNQWFNIEKKNKIIFCHRIIWINIKIVIKHTHVLKCKKNLTRNNNYFYNLSHMITFITRIIRHMYNLMEKNIVMVLLNLTPCSTSSNTPSSTTPATTTSSTGATGFVAGVTIGIAAGITFTGSATLSSITGFSAFSVTVSTGVSVVSILLLSSTGSSLTSNLMQSTSTFSETAFYHLFRSPDQYFVSYLLKWLPSFWSLFCDCCISISCFSSSCISSSSSSSSSRISISSISLCSSISSRVWNKASHNLHSGCKNCLSFYNIIIYCNTNFIQYEFILQYKSLPCVYRFFDAQLVVHKNLRKSGLEPELPPAFLLLDLCLLFVTRSKSISLWFSTALI
ncbi:hypothetical protein AGLY_008942 [Aphis glycines]|uniref:Uncharacterized protein n=1 Tax=Aphis glycines TaxID=307491 RepID=A0A6G0TJJ0_APHGL|nr:hypothetical protein AGLY_008942 [Aphis glycines]